MNAKYYQQQNNGCSVDKLQSNVILRKVLQLGKGIDTQKNKRFLRLYLWHMTQPIAKYVIEKEYLEFERNALDKHEYYRGEIFAMSCASYRHNLIESNLRGSLNSFLKGKKCREFGSNLRVHIPKNTLYTYPDILVICDEPDFVDDEFDTITNPSIIIEILSPSTTNYDRGVKFDLYREIAGLNEYLLIDSKTIHTITYTKNNDATWTLAETKNLNGNVLLSSIGFSIPLTEIYDGFDKLSR